LCIFLLLPSRIPSFFNIFRQVNYHFDQTIFSRQARATKYYNPQNTYEIV
jgi:hypothetical protein